MCLGNRLDRVLVIGLVKMSTRKYDEFAEGCVLIQKSKTSPYNECRYIPIACPHCKVMFVEIKEADIKTSKASKCLKHLRVCEVFKEKGGEVAPKRSMTTSTAMVLIPEKRSEVETLRAEMAEMKQEIKGLQDKTGLYDSVLTAVLPSLQLPLTAPEENAKITLRQAAMKDITPLALPAPIDVVPKAMHTAMIEQKDQMLATEKERREELKEAHTQALEKYKKVLEAKESELNNTKYEKEQAVKNKNVADLRALEASRTAQEASNTVVSLSTRTEELQRERDALKYKYNAMLKGHEQAVRNYGKHGSSQLSKLQQGQKRAIADIDVRTAAAVAIEKEFAAKRARAM